MAAGEFGCDGCLFGLDGDDPAGGPRTIAGRRGSWRSPPPVPDADSQHRLRQRQHLQWPRRNRLVHLGQHLRQGYSQSRWIRTNETPWSPIGISYNSIFILRKAPNFTVTWRSTAECANLADYSGECRQDRFRRRVKRFVGFSGGISLVGDASCFGPRTGLRPCCSDRG